MQSWQRRLSVFQASFQQQRGVTHSIAFPAPHLHQKMALELLLWQLRARGRLPGQAALLHLRGGVTPGANTRLLMPKSRTRMRAGACRGAPGCPEPPVRGCQVTPIPARPLRSPVRAPSAT